MAQTLLCRHWCAAYLDDEITAIAQKLYVGTDLAATTEQRT